MEASEDDQQPYDPSQGTYDFGIGGAGESTPPGTPPQQQTTPPGPPHRSPITPENRPGTPPHTPPGPQAAESEVTAAENNEQQMEEEGSYEDDEVDDEPEIVLNTEAVKDAKQQEYQPLRTSFGASNNTNFKQQPPNKAAPININLNVFSKTQFQRIPSHQTRGNEQKTIFDLDIDSLDEKPWRKPGADITHYFNYGFTEESWRAYCQKQIQMRLEQNMQGKIKVYESNKTGGELPPEIADVNKRRPRPKPGAFSRHRMRDRDESVIQQLTDGRPQEDQEMGESPERSLSPPPEFRHGPMGPGPFGPIMPPRGFRPPPFYPPRGGMREGPFRHRGPPPDFEDSYNRERDRERDRDGPARRNRDYRERDSRRHSPRERDEKSKSGGHRSEERSERSSNRNHRPSKSSRKRSRSKEKESEGSDERSKRKKS